MNIGDLVSFAELVRILTVIVVLVIAWWVVAQLRNRHGGRRP